MSAKVAPTCSPASALRPPALSARPGRSRQPSVSSDPSTSSVSNSASASRSPVAVRVVRTKTNVPKFMRQSTIAGRHGAHQSAILGAVEVHERALFCLWPDHPLRRFCIELANAPLYTNFNLALILINCGTLMVESGRTLGTDYNFSSLSSTLNCVDAFFAAAFSLELIVKVIAGGFLFAGSSSYLRSSWNCLDGLVVLFALLNFIPSMSNFTYIRALRLIRPLKAASSIPGLRVMMNAMLAATMTLGNVFLFVFLLLFTFALFGLQIYRDTFWYRCVPLSDGFLSFDLLYGFAGCSESDTFPIPLVGPTLCDDSEFFCANSGRNPYADTMGYDNILKSWVMSLIVMSGEGWSDIMYMAEDAVSSLSCWFFIALTCLSNYLGGELVVAVMSVKFEDAKVEEQEKMREEEEQKLAVRAAQRKIRDFKRNQRRIAKAKKRSKGGKQTDVADKTAATSNATTVDVDKLMEDETMSSMRDAEMLTGDLETAQVMQLAAVIKSQNRQKAFDRQQQQQLVSRQQNSGGSHTPRPHPFGMEATNLSAPPRNMTFASASNSHAAAAPPPVSALKQPAALTLTASGKRDSLQYGAAPQKAASRNSAITSRGGANAAAAAAGNTADGPQRGSLLSLLSLNSHLISDTTTSELTQSSKEESITSTLSRLNTSFNSAASKWSMHSAMSVPLPSFPTQASRAREWWHQVRLLCHRLVFSSASFWLFSFLTVLNCCMLGVDHWGISASTAAVLQTFDTVFFACFLLEFLLRIVAIEWAYFSYGYFILDLVIVVIAGIDSGLGGSVPAVSALKAFRVFRMFTVFRYWKAMQRIMKQAHSSLQDLFYFSLVLFLFVFIFAQMGVQIAKDREQFPQPEGAARDNWDSIGWAMIVVFQVSTPENWNQVLYDIVQGVGWGGGVFVIITLLVGHYIIESLFVVVMFSHFGAEDVADDADQRQQRVGTAEAAGPGRSAAVVPIDHVQQMLNRAGVGGGGSGPQTLDESSHGANGINRQQSFDSPILTRPATFISRPTTARTSRRAVQWTGDAAAGADEVTRVDGWVDNDSNAAADAALPSARAPSQPDTARGDEKASPRPESPAIFDAPSPPSGSRPELVIRHPVGFLSGSAPLGISSKGFLGRLARNIERSKRLKAEQDREKELEKIKARSRSATASRRGSRKASAADGGERGSVVRSLVGVGGESKRGSFSAVLNAAGSGDSTERRATERTAREQQTADEAEDGTDELPGAPASAMRVQFAVSQKEDKKHRDEEAEAKKPTEEISPKLGQQTPAAAAADPLTLTQELKAMAATASAKEEQSASADSAELVRPLALSLPSAPLLRTAQSPSVVVLPPLAIVPALPASVLPTKASMSSISSLTSHSSADEPPALPTPPQQEPAASTRLPLPARSSSSADDEPLPQPSPVLIIPPSPVLAPNSQGQTLSDAHEVSGSGLPPPAAPVPAPPAYDAHILRPRRRFVIPHHFPAGQPWYRQEMPAPFTSSSMYLFSPTNRFRLLLTRALHSDAWSIGVLLLIFSSCVLLALDYPALDADSLEGQTLYWADLVTTVLYTVEMLCRFVVFGVWMEERSCLRNGWNVMEFGIVLVSIASTIVPSVKELKALRALRPLRILSRLPGAKLVVSSLGKSMLNIANVLVVAFLLLFTLAIVAIELFKGRLQQCLQPPDGAQILVDEVDCAANGGVWVNPLWIGNYDDLGAALLVLFEICTEENWPTTMTTAVDATAPGLAPQINYNQWVGIYFVIAIVVGSLFIKTLFTATILDGYSVNYAEITGAGGGTSPLQRQWLDFYKLTIDMPPPLSKPRPTTRWFSSFDLKIRRFFFDTAKSRSFEYCFLGVISLNVVVLSMPFSYQPNWYADMLTIINSVCTWLFVAEILILWLGLGLRDYFRSRFNQFDFVIIILTAYEFFYDMNLAGFQIGFNPSIFRVIRMIRIRKLFQKFPRLVQLGKTVWFSLPSLYNVTLLMVLEYFIFSVLGMALFGKVKHGFYMTNHGNYETFTSAMVTLFREMTGENWNGIMRDCMVQPPFCDEDVGDCGNTLLSPLFHVGFQIMSAMLVMDLIVAIILNQFENQLEKEKRMDAAIMSERDMRLFGEHWAHFSASSYTMPVPKLPAFLRYLPPPLGTTRDDRDRQLYGVEMAHFLDELKIPTDSQNVHYLDVVHQLGYRAFRKKYPEIVQMEDEEEKSLHALLPDDDDDDDEQQEQDVNERRSSSGSLGSVKPRPLNATPSSSSLALSYTTAGIRLANEDVSLMRRQAQRQFPSLLSGSRWSSFAGQVHRVVICQKMLRGVFDRRRLRQRLVAPLLQEMHEEQQQQEVEEQKKEGDGTQGARQRLYISTSETISEASDEKQKMSRGEDWKELPDSKRDSVASMAAGPSFLHQRLASTSSPSMLLTASPSGSGRSNSVVAEVMAVRALRQQQSQLSLGQNRSLSNLLQTPKSRAGAAAAVGAGVQGHAAGSLSPSSLSQSATPLLIKAVSLPLASTREENHEELEAEGMREHKADHRPTLETTTVTKTEVGHTAVKEEEGMTVQEVPTETTKTRAGAQ